MNAETPRPPSDSELDRLLASKLRRTSPEFELRWRELRAQLAGSSKPARAVWPRWLLWPGFAGAALAALAVVFVVRRSTPPLADGSRITFAELVALDAALQPAAPLLDGENRDALLNLPAQPRR
jgi:hypothetical protein